ncbi:hypothetical protein AB0877_07270 [Micromonospora sp. NPDC047644]|uniref:hypothetical protein n=1 Tax=Micromonospora sp. NPDC047644 TaxID=3157203 RepID=UPI003456466A
MFDEREQQRPLEPGEIVRVGPTLIQEMGAHLYVVIDGFNEPLYTLACLGGDGYQWPNVDRRHIISVTPERIIRSGHTDEHTVYLPE